MDRGRENPLDDGLDSPKNRGRKPKRIYSRYSRTQALVDLATAFRWHLLLVAIILSALYAYYRPTPADVPVEVWSLLFYVAIGALPGAVLAYLLVNWLTEVRGVEILDLDPVTDSHRHLRVGNKLWDDMEVQTPWGETAGESDLRRCSINGRQGFEVMDMRIEDGRPTCVATWMGEASGTEMRTFKSAYRHAHSRLARRADKATMLRANQGEIAREAAEEVVYRLITTSEESGMPNGSEIEGVVSDVLSDAGLNSPLDEDRRDARIETDTEPSTKTETESKPLSDLMGEVDDNQPVAPDGGQQ